MTREQLQVSTETETAVMKMKQRKMMKHLAALIRRRCPILAVSVSVRRNRLVEEAKKFASLIEFMLLLA